MGRRLDQQTGSLGSPTAPLRILRDSWPRLRQNDLLQWIMEAKRTDAQDKTIPERVMSANAAAIQSSSMVCTMIPPVISSPF